MVMVADAVPSLKRWIGALGLKDSAKLLVVRLNSLARFWDV